MTRCITLTKKIAKQGNNLVIVIPKYLQEFMKAGEIVRIEIEKLQLEEENE